MKTAAIADAILSFLGRKKPPPQLVKPFTIKCRGLACAGADGEPCADIEGTVYWFDKTPLCATCYPTVERKASLRVRAMIPFALFLVASIALPQTRVVVRAPLPRLTLKIVPVGIDVRNEYSEYLMTLAATEQSAKAFAGVLTMRPNTPVYLGAMPVDPGGFPPTYTMWRQWWHGLTPSAECQQAMSDYFFSVAYLGAAIAGVRKCPTCTTAWLNLAGSVKTVSRANSAMDASCAEW